MIEEKWLATLELLKIEQNKNSDLRAKLEAAEREREASRNVLVKIADKNRWRNQPVIRAIWTLVHEAQQALGIAPGEDEK